MGLFGKVKKAVKKGAKTTYKRVVKPTARRIGSDAKRTYKSTAGKAIRTPDVSPRKAYKAARRVVGAPSRIAGELRNAGKPKKARPRRRR